MDTKAYQELLVYMTSKTYPEDAMKNKRRLREKAESFIISGDVLMHKGRKERMHRVLQQPERGAVVTSMHALVVGECHFGVNATHRKIAEHYCWPTRMEDTCYIVRTCGSYDVNDIHCLTLVQQSDYCVKVLWSCRVAGFFSCTYSSNWNTLTQQVLTEHAFFLEIATHGHCRSWTFHSITGRQWVAYCHIIWLALSLKLLQK